MNLYHFFQINKSSYEPISLCSGQYFHINLSLKGKICIIYIIESTLKEHLNLLHVAELYSIIKQLQSYRLSAMKMNQANTNPLITI